MVDRLGAVAVPFSDLQFGGEAVDPFFNINTPEDLALAEALLAGSSSPPHKAERNAPFVVGVAGWKNSGKTTLVERLVATLVRRGYRVSTIKHSHHDVSFEAEGTDSARHLRAGAQEVALISPRRWAVLRAGQQIAWREEGEPALATVVRHLAPADIVIVEGLKRAQIPKIEVRRTAQGDGPPLAADDPFVFAIAADHGIADGRVPSFALDDVAGLADALLTAGGVKLPRERA
ncbi:MAG: molybdopterin-guanine dinucleotide biosynthesis protein B [Rhizobiales bacterium]|nr:molybdopterin-guanine dinucleotide biosynthesis protein B [Hyphomicrobiales bacterium]